MLQINPIEIGGVDMPINDKIETQRLLLQKLRESDAAMVRRVYDEGFETDEQALSFIRWVNNRNMC